MAWRPSRPWEILYSKDQSSLIISLKTKKILLPWHCNQLLEPFWLPNLNLENLSLARVLHKLSTQHPSLVMNLFPSRVRSCTFLSKCNHIISGLLWLDSFTHHLFEVHSCHRMYQYLILFYCEKVPLYGHTAFYFHQSVDNWVIPT